MPPPTRSARGGAAHRWAHTDVNHLREYDVVRVTRLLTRDRRFDGTESIRRAPKVGDVATICHEYDPHDTTAVVAVEMVDENGLTVWLADFERAELELVQRS